MRIRDCFSLVPHVWRKIITVQVEKIVIIILNVKNILKYPFKGKQQREKTVIVTVKAIYLFYPSEEGQFHSMNRSLCFPAKVNTLPPSLAILPLLIIHCVYYGRFFPEKWSAAAILHVLEPIFFYDLLKVIKGIPNKVSEALVACGLNNKK